LVTINAQNDAQVILNFFKTLEEFVEKNYEELMAQCPPVEA
jgi:hypothetical protein